jgi:hypothetical protein
MHRECCAVLNGACCLAGSVSNGNRIPVRFRALKYPVRGSSFDPSTPHKFRHLTRSFARK